MWFIYIELTERNLMQVSTKEFHDSFSYAKFLLVKSVFRLMSILGLR